jgi:hypothetical protein
MVIRKVGVGSAAKISGALYAVIGLIMGAIFAMISILSGAMATATSNDVPSWIAPLFGVGAIVVAPILYGVMGLIGGAVAALVYNLVAGMAGGLEIEVD